MVDHLGRDDGFYEKIARMVRREALAVLQNSSVGRAGIRFYEGGRALFQGGGGVEIQDTGYIIINGSLTGLGEFNWEGTFVQTGQSTFTGPTTFTGTINATGNTAWSGIMSIVGELRVLPGGKIQVGNMIIDPANGGSVQFPGIGAIRADTNGVLLEAGNTFAVVRQGFAYIGLPGQSFSVDGLNGPRIQGLPTVSSASTGLPIGTLYVDPSGYLYRVAF